MPNQEPHRQPSWTPSPLLTTQYHLSNPVVPTNTGREWKGNVGRGRSYSTSTSSSSELSSDPNVNSGRHAQYVCIVPAFCKARCLRVFSNDRTMVDAGLLIRTGGTVLIIRSTQHLSPTLPGRRLRLTLSKSYSQTRVNDGMGTSRGSHSALRTTSGNPIHNSRTAPSTPIPQNITRQKQPLVPYHPIFAPDQQNPNYPFYAPSMRKQTQITSWQDPHYAPHTAQTPIIYAAGWGQGTNIQPGAFSTVTYVLPCDQNTSYCVSPPVAFQTTTAMPTYALAAPRRGRNRGGV